MNSGVQAPLPEVSIIIVNWKSLDYLCACLKSVYRETSGITFEVIVVDNASGDDCEPVLSKDFPLVQFIQSPVNLGFAKANNLAYRHSRGEIVVFLNPDTEVIGDALVRMAQHLRAHDSVGAVGGRLLNSDGTLQTSCVQAFPTILNQVLDSAALRKRFPAMWGMKALFGETVADVEVISGACFVIKRQVFDEVGLFTDEYFMYSEDFDLSHKIRQARYRIQYLPGCQIIHHGGTSSAKQGDCFASVWQKESFLQFFRGTRGSFYGSCYKAAIAGASSVRIAMILASFAIPGSFQNKGRRTALRKWQKNFSWALGINPMSGKAPGSQAIGDAAARARI